MLNCNFIESCVPGFNKVYENELIGLLFLKWKPIYFRYMAKAVYEFTSTQNRSGKYCRYLINIVYCEVTETKYSSFKIFWKNFLTTIHSLQISKSLLRPPRDYHKKNLHE